MKRLSKYSNIMMLIFAVMMAQSSGALESYQSSEQMSLSKYERIERIEKYLEKLSKQFDQKLNNELKLLDKRIKELENRNETKNIDKQVAELKKTISALDKKFDERYAKLESDLNSQIKKNKDDANQQLESVSKSLLTQITALQKIIAGFSRPKDIKPAIK